MMNSAIRLLRRRWQQARGATVLADDAGFATARHQFLPAALEVQDTPPSPAARWLAAVLVSLFAIALAWACIGQVDIVVTAPGRIIASGQVKVIQPLETATIQQIHVAEGDLVKKGQVLVSLDPTYATADLASTRQRSADLALQLSWRTALDRWLQEPTGSDRDTGPNLPAIDDPEQRQRAAQRLQQQQAEITARATALRRQRQAAAAELAMATAELHKVTAALPLLDEQVAAYKYLHDKQYGAKVHYLQMQQQQVELEKSIPVLEARRRQLQESIAGLAAQEEALLAEQRKTNLLELDRIATEFETMRQTAIKAEQRRRQQVLTAPVAGTVQQLAIHTPGGVVTPAQPLLVIVPEHAKVEVEALVANKDIGFVETGQASEVKVDTFNFTRYGVIPARVEHIARDAVADEHLGWVFPMRLALESDTIQVGDKRVHLSPGMSIMAEIKTGQRRLIEFFLSPLLRYRDESVRER